MMIFKKAIPRRAFLGGMGATVALPLLDAMVPALALVREDPTAKLAQRWVVVNTPNGVIMEAWGAPAGEGGAVMELGPILEPLAPFRDRLLLINGLAQHPAVKRDGEVGGDHPRASATYLTCTHPKETGGADIGANISIDQVAAREFSKNTQLGSLELGMENHEVLGACEANYSCAYYNTLSWRDPKTPLMTEHNPRVVFERLFGAGDSTDPAERLARMGRRRSILDFVSESAALLRRELGPSDNAKVSQYLDSVRDVERSIQVAEERVSSSPEMPSLSRPAGVPATFEEHIQLMFDLVALAFQSDMTRIVTFMYGQEMGGLSYPQLGYPDNFHALTHHQGDRKLIDACIEIETYNTKMFSYLVEKLRSTPEGDGSLLDNSLLQFGTALGDGNLHSHYDIPVLLVTGGPGQIKGGRHLRFPVEKNIPLANMYLTIMDKLGIPLESFGDSTGRLDLS